MTTYQKELVDAYFKGGNAKDKTAEEIRRVIKVIKEEALKSD